MLAATLLAFAFTARAADVVLAATGAGPSAAGASSAGPSMRVDPVRPGLYRIGSPESQAVVRVGAGGVVVVDPPAAAMHAALLAEIQRIAATADAPVRALVFTAADASSSSTVDPFIDAGVPVIVQQRALAELVRQARTTSAASSRFISYDTDYQIRFGEVEVEVEHVGSGRTGADSVVVFRGLRAVAVGGLFTTDTPQPDCASGGSFAGWAAAIDHLLWSDFDIALPSRGAAIGKPELVEFKAKLEALAARARSSPSAAADCGRSK